MVKVREKLARVFSNKLFHPTNWLKDKHFIKIFKALEMKKLGQVLLDNLIQIQAQPLNSFKEVTPKYYA